MISDINAKNVQSREKNDVVDRTSVINDDELEQTQTTIKTLDRGCNLLITCRGARCMADGNVPL